MVTLSQIISRANRNSQKISILLGNGFNLAAGYEKFDYKSLADLVSKNLPKDSNLSKLIEEKSKSLQSNLELFIKHFQETSDGLEFLTIDTSYMKLNDTNISPNLLPNIAEDMLSLKKETLKALKGIHPENISKKEQQFEICAENLRNFDYIFTLNYDLILYWLIMIINEKNKNKFRDGMNKEHEKIQYKNSLNLWSSFNNSYNVFYLHGAIHLVEDENKNTCKVIRNENFKSLKDLVEELLHRYKGLKNIIVLEGATTEKESYIFNNEYLKEGLLRLTRKSGILVIYGCSIVGDDGDLNNDNHIWKKIIQNSEFSNIYIGIYEDPQRSFEIQKACIKKAMKNHTFDRRKTPSIEFFSINENNMWNEKLS